MRFEMLSEIARLADEIQAATEQRDQMIRAALQAGCRRVDIAAASGLSRHTIASRAD